MADLITPENGIAKTYDVSDEGLHPAGSETYWQESVAFYWYDLKNKAGGVMRFGHEPNLERGNVTLWAHIHTPEWAYCHSHEHEKRLDDASLTHLAAGGIARYSFDGASTRWSLNDGLVSCDLEVIPLHKPLGLWPLDTDAAKDVGAHHFEVANTVRGTVEIQGRKLEINGHGHRDHSWGVRDWTTFRVHRWVNGVFGPDLCFCISTFSMAGRPAGAFGYVIRDGIVHHTSDIDVVTYMESDGATHRGGVVTIRLADGEELIFRCKLACKGFIAQKRTANNFEALCEVEHNGRAGVGAFETNENARGGAERPSNLFNAWDGYGIFKVGLDD